MAQKEVKGRIASVKNIQKITRAMEMIAAARLRKAEQRVQELRDYGYDLDEEGQPLEEGDRGDAERAREEGAEERAEAEEAEEQPEAVGAGS